MHLFFDLTHFRELGQNYRNILVRFLVQMKTLKFASEINWPLGAKCKGKTLLVIEIFFTLHRYCTALHCHSPVLVLSIQSKTWQSVLSSLAEWAQNSNFITTTGSWLDLEGRKYLRLIRLLKNHQILITVLPQIVSSLE